MAFAATISVSSLNGANGFSLVGDTGDYAGFSVSAAGDFNGDGIKDFIVGTYGQGAAYVVFGTARGFPASLNLATLDGHNGFALTGPYGLGFSVAGIGDFNGDGLSDIAISEPWLIEGDGYTYTYVVFGRNTAVAGDFPAAVNVPGLDETQAIRFGMFNPVFSIYSGFSVASAGDINGDGFSDLIIGEPGNHVWQRDYSIVEVVMGRGDSSPMGPWPQSNNLNDTSGPDGFTFTSLHDYAYVGTSVASAGDVNGDGVNDIIVGGPGVLGGSGRAAVIFGKRSGSVGDFSGNLDDSTLDGVHGFQLTGFHYSHIGASVSGVGDINGDGFDDIFVSDWGSIGYVVFGKGAGFAPVVDLTRLDGTNGFAVNGVGVGVAAGDLNGDGIDDLALGGGGAAYVVFGKRTAFSGVFNLTTLNGTTGFKVTGPGVGSSLAGVGDVNQDGIDDLLIGASSKGGGPTTPGAAYIVFGQTATPAGRTINGGANDDTLNGAAGNDTINGGGGKDTIHGLAGDDTINGGAGNDTLYGDGGKDHILGGLGNDILDGGDADDVLEGGDGADKLNGVAGNDTLYGNAGADLLNGGAGADKLYGGADNDTLDGGAGNDIMQGGAGNDVYLVDSALDALTENLNEGWDIVKASVTYALPDNFETLELQGSAALNGTGNALGNTLNGNSAANVLSGLQGNDKIDGKEGDDTLYGGADSDTLTGGLGADTLYGEAGADTLTGGDGADRLVGGFGADKMTGGAGNDVFALDSDWSGETDTITDYAPGDILDFSALDAFPLTEGHQPMKFAPVFVYGNAFPQMTMTYANGTTVIRIDHDGDALADYIIKINGNVTGDVSHWIF